MRNFILFTIVLVSTVFMIALQNKSSEPILPDFDYDMNQIICIQEGI